MKNCREINEMMSLYIDNELDNESRKRFEEHIQACESCKKEMEDILYVINLCKDMEEEELPENFREELHMKLLQAKESGEDAGKVVSLRDRYIRIFATIAAGVLLVVLARGFFTNNNFLPGGAGMSAKTKNATAAPKERISSAEMQAADQAEEPKAGEEKIAMGLAEETGANEDTGTMMQEKTDPDQSASSAMKVEGGAGQTEASRSLGALNRQLLDGNGQSGVQFGAAEALSNRVVSIAFTVEDPQTKADKVNMIAAENGAEPYIRTYGNIAVKKAEMYSTANAAASNITTLSYRVQNKNYEAFKKAIENNFGKSGVQINLITEDATVQLNELNTRIAEIDTALKEEERGSETQDLDALKAEKESLQLQIEELIYNAEYYTFITVNIMKK